MYYWLSNNKIMKDEKYKIMEIDGCLHKVDVNGFTIKNFGKILKQSEKITDLIEPSDIVIVSIPTGYGYYRLIKAIIVTKEGIEYICDNAIVRKPISSCEEIITKILKLDDKGDYINSWNN